MNETVVRIIGIEPLTHDVIRFRVEKPVGYVFSPGQATDVSINSPGFREKKNPFSFTCLNSDPYLEFTIKIYAQRKGVTNELSKLRPGHELIIREPWGAISYRGKGVFIAGGAGITPFIAIFRDLSSRNEIAGNRLLFANKTKEDIILEEEFRKLAGNDFVNILSHEEREGYYHGFVTAEFLKSNISDFNTSFYLCGPPLMMRSVQKILADFGVEKNSITLEL